ncbi:ribbon-helix-helix protein, CopG family [Glycomyces harbinensis]|uniref:Ribbon-helix-helix protein, copG family n=1 Tax=Glycomyces harbinensis TaxID=58114 RepID=A0A1G6UCL5_9ACTN|nr:ribbon-helix-helix protein, CopG family [Glycomyces harbinensis]SDD38989.1 Ribbon-helix-helix protein, copG family [Glycomyces harbinensis]
MEAKRQFNIYLPADLVQRVKHASVDADLSLSVFVERALEEHLRRLADDKEGSS